MERNKNIQDPTRKPALGTSPHQLRRILLQPRKKRRKRKRKKKRRRKRKKKRAILRRAHMLSRNQTPINANTLHSEMLKSNTAKMIS